MHLEKEHLKHLDQSFIKKILYIGPWHHIQPVRDFPHVKEFIFIDTQPRSEFDNNTFYNRFYKCDFYDDLIHKCICFGFELKTEYVIDQNYYKSIFTIRQRLYYSLWDVIPKHINPTLLTFYNETTKQTIKYYISTNIKYTMTPTLQRDIEESDALIVSGYHPNIKLLEYFTKPKIFIGYSNTCYDLNKDKDNEEDSIISLLHQTDKTEYFYNFLAVSYKKGQMKDCTDIFDLKIKCLKL
jgi:hypothetical protein